MTEAGSRGFTVCIAVPTTGTRPSSLRACLAGLRSLEKPSLLDVTVLLVQNGVSCPSLDDLEEVAASFPAGDLVAVAEPRKGIPFARNAALAHAQEHKYDFLAFIDDDAEPTKSWLKNLWAKLEIGDVAAVTGPQIPVYPESAPVHLRGAEIYRERRMQDGVTCKWAATNNVIFSVPWASRSKLSFDNTLITGGEDKQFFRRFSARGGRIVWANDAIVHEAVVPDRLSFGWAIRRAYRFGATGFVIEQSDQRPWHAATVCFAKGVTYLLGGTALLAASVLLRGTSAVDGSCRIAHGVGFILGVFQAFRPRRYA